MIGQAAEELEDVAVPELTACVRVSAGRAGLAEIARDR
jgi:hypothetical protein